MPNIETKSFDIPDRQYSFQIMKIDRKIDSINQIVANMAGEEGSELKIDSLLDKSAEYQLTKEAIVNQVGQQVVPLVVPEVFLNIPSRISFDYETSSVLVSYDVDQYNAYMAEHKEKDIEDESEIAVEEDENEKEEHLDIEDESEIAVEEDENEKEEHLDSEMI